MRITIKKKFVIFFKLFERISNFSFDISQSSIGHLLQNGSLKLNVIKLFLLFFITHTGGTPPPPNTPSLTYPQEPACVILTLLGFFCVYLQFLCSTSTDAVITKCTYIQKIIETHFTWHTFLNYIIKGHHTFIEDLNYGNFKNV